jgi:predicted nucleic acid-binding protein
VERIREVYGSALLEKGGLLPVLDKLWQDLNICMCLSNSSLQALEEKEERGMLQ